MRSRRLLPLLLSLSILTGCAGSLAQPQGALKPLSPPSVSLPPVEPCREMDAGTLEGYNAFALELLRRNAAGGENVLLSPLSVTLALGMTANGSAQDTRKEFEALFGLSVEDLNSLCARFLADYAQLGGSTQAILVNSLWADPDAALSDDFVLRCQETYGAQLFQQDLQAPETVAAVNGWVDEATRGLIPSVVDRFDEDAILALVNAVYLKNQFARPFADPHSDWELDFTAADGTVTHPKGMSNGTRNEEYISAQDAQGVVLPYDDGRLGLLLMLPREGLSLSEYLSGWDSGTVPALLSARQTARVHLTCPKFEVQWSASLGDTLKGMGLSRAFDDKLADFTAMGSVPSRPESNICIGDVIHKTAFALNEKGTEAAAVTAVIMMAPTSAMEPQQPIELRLDRPFVYGIVDLDTGAALFLGTAESVEGRRTGQQKG